MEKFYWNVIRRDKIMKQIIHYLPDWKVYMQAIFVFLVPYLIWKLYKQNPATEEEQ
jgi:hypothetical protein